MALTRIKTDQITNEQVTSADLAQNLTLVGPTTISGKILTGNQIGNANLVNVVNFATEVGIAAYRTINLIDSSAGIKLARITDSLSLAPTVEFQVWTADMTQNTAYWDTYADAAGFAIRDRNVSLTRDRIYISPTGNVLLGSTSTNTAGSLTQVTNNGVTNILQVQGDSYFSGNVNVVANTTTDAVRITQTGTGNAFVVEDSASPDSTPFVIDNFGLVINGSTTKVNADDAGGSIRTAWAYQANNTTTSGAGYLASYWANDINGAGGLSIAKSRGAAVNTRAVVQSGDELGQIGFLGDDGTDFISAAGIFAHVDGTPATDSMPGRLMFSTTASGSSTPTERMRIHSDGVVSIGNTLASQPLLTVNQPVNITLGGTSIGGGGQNAGTIKLLNSGSLTQGNNEIATAIAFTGTSSGTRRRALIGAFQDGSASANPTGLLFATYSSTTTTSDALTERMRIDSSGNVGIGTTTPTEILTVNGTVLATNVVATSNPLVQQSDIGTAANKIPLNQYLGELAYMNKSQLVVQPQQSVTPAALGDMVFELTNDTTLVVKVRGSDGVVRSVTLTLA